jgi:glycosyltransferase involved in cell wall biosynthesis
MSLPDAVTVLFANNYDMRKARAGWLTGTYPAHHLFGTTDLGPPFEVVDLPHHEFGLCARLTRLGREKRRSRDRFGRSGRLGDVGQQLAVLRSRRRPAIVYGAAAQELRALAALRGARLLHIPVVGVFHGVPYFGPRMSIGLRGFDRAIAMSQHTRDALLAAGLPARRIEVLGWGPDLDFPGFQAPVPIASDSPLVASGKTRRDMTTLLRALAGLEVPARVYCRSSQLDGSVAIPGHVQLVEPEPPRRSTPGPLSYEHTLVDLRSAAVVAIPLKETHPLFGLTEVVDALACARPLILTRAPYFDFDIERIGCGWWVERGDVDGWVERLREAFSDRERLQRMGRAGHEWARERFNARLFADGVRRVLLDALAGV